MITSQHLAIDKWFIVFVRTIAECDTLAEDVGGAGYYAGWIGAVVDVIQWKVGKRTVMVTTLTMTSTEIRYIKLAIPMGCPVNLKTYVERSHWSGRGDRAGLSIIWTTLNELLSTTTVADEEVTAYIGSESCRRMYLEERFSTGPNPNTSRANTEICDNCEANWKGFSSTFPGLPSPPAIWATPCQQTMRKVSRMPCQPYPPP